MRPANVSECSVRRVRAPTRAPALGRRYHRQRFDARKPTSFDSRGICACVTGASLARWVNCSSSVSRAIEICADASRAANTIRSASSRLNSRADAASRVEKRASTRTRTRLRTFEWRKRARRSTRESGVASRATCRQSQTMRTSRSSVIRRATMRVTCGTQCGSRCQTT